MKKFLQTLTILSFLFLSTSIFAQKITGNILGSVVDGAEAKIQASTITLHKAADSSLAKITISDEKGNYSFDKMPLGKYFVSASASGYEKTSSDVFILSDEKSTINIKPIMLNRSVKMGGDVVIQSKRPLVQVKPGKMIVNVDASPSNAGLNALEVLEKSPGISLDNDGNISIKGKGGVIVMIDGKLTYMKGAELTNLLKSIQSNNLDQLEIMTNPPSKYDAEGNNGMINIKTKKGLGLGFNGSAISAVSYAGKDLVTYSQNLNLNYRNAKTNVYSNIEAGTFSNIHTMQIDRRIYVPGSRNLSRTIDQKSRRTSDGEYYNVKLGIDHQLTKKDMIGVLLFSNNWGEDEDVNSNTNIRNLQNIPTSVLRSLSFNDNKSHNFTTNLNYKHTGKKPGSELTVDLDYGNYFSKNKSELITGSYDNNNVKHGSDVILRGRIPSKVHIYSAKADYTTALSETMKLEAGVKAAVVKTDNESSYLRSLGSEFVKDNRSNHFTYTENINAAYVNLNKTHKKTEISLGLRLENTNLDGHQKSNDSSFSRNYASLFPNLGLSQKINDNHSLNFSYSRRIGRPQFRDLNPFTFFIDSITYGVGNPYLQPEFSNNIEISHQFKGFLTTTLNYSVTNDIISDIIRQDPISNVGYQTKENMNSAKQYGIAFMANHSPTKWYNFNLYTNFFYNEFEGTYNNDKISLSSAGFMGNLSNNFKIGKSWNADLSGFYRSKGIEETLTMNDMWGINVGISKKFKDQKGSLKLGVRDLFNSQQFSGKIYYSDVDLNVRNNRYSRKVTLTYTYRFGKKEVKSNRERKGGATEEASRVGG